jgi:hypothetical protein
MFARQWFEPCSQLALSESAHEFESLLRKRHYSKAVELANGNIDLGSDSKEMAFWVRQRLRTLRLQKRGNFGSLISVAFRGFWPGFEQQDNEILNVFRRASAIIGAQIEVNSPDPDLLIFSCFGDPGFGEFPKATRILYLGENVRPDFSVTDYSMTFDISNYCGRNIYMPLWLLRSTHYAPKTACYQSYDAKELEQSRPANNGRDAVVYIGNNCTPNRLEAIHELTRSNIVVDCYGSHTRPVINKIDTLSKYKYTLCFENTYTPGYVTEKIIDSFLGGSHPIYWGGASPEVFNLEEYFVCDPFETIYTNIVRFHSWREHNLSVALPPLLRKGAFTKIDKSVMKFIGRLLFELF